MLCVEDFIDSLEWSEKIGGLEELIRRSKDYLNIIKAFGLEFKKTLLVTSETDSNIYLSSRNLKNSKVIINSELNTYEITDANNILILESAVEGIETTLK